MADGDLAVARVQIRNALSDLKGKQEEALKAYEDARKRHDELKKQAQACRDEVQRCSRRLTEMRQRAKKLNDALNAL